MLWYTYLVVIFMELCATGSNVGVDPSASKVLSSLFFSVVNFMLRLSRVI